MTDTMIRLHVQRMADLRDRFNRYWLKEHEPKLKRASKLDQAAAMIQEWQRWRKEQV